jgi:hypothetical protein
MLKLLREFINQIGFAVGDGYFWLCSSKSSFRGAETKRVKIRSSQYNNRVAKKDFKKEGSK